MGEAGEVGLRRAFAWLCFGMIIVVVLSGAAWGENWPAWRGPRGDGTSLEKDVPVEWSAAQNVVWKVAIPGKGHASPIVWVDRIFIVSALE
jgi:hypothetical protein